MSYACDLTGKGKQFGKNVSFSQRHTAKVWKPNLQKKTVIINGQKVRLKLAASTIRTLKKLNSSDSNFPIQLQKLAKQDAELAKAIAK